MTQSPDAVLFAACAAARNVEAGQREPGERLAALFGLERLAFECVAATRAQTPRGMAEKALLLGECGETVEAVSLALSLALDAIAQVGALLSAGAQERDARRLNRRAADVGHAARPSI